MAHGRGHIKASTTQERIETRMSMKDVRREKRKKKEKKKREKKNRKKKRKEKDKEGKDSVGANEACREGGTARTRAHDL